MNLAASWRTAFLHAFTKHTAAFVACLFCFGQGGARDVALKSNLLYDAALSPNLGVEVQVAPKWSIDLSGNINFWTLSDGKRWKHWLIQPEARYWFCQPLGGHFVGAHVLGGIYNVGNIGRLGQFLNTDLGRLAGNRFEGWGVGAGIAYGYSWLLGRHWNLEAEIGLGWVYSRYDEFECVGCGRKTDSDRVHNYVGPTKAAINIVYVF